MNYHAKVTLKTLPGPRTLNPLGSYHEFRAQPIAFIERQIAIFGESLKFRVGPRVYCYFQSPEHVREVLTAGPDRFPRADAAYQISKVLGAGLVTTDGEVWRAQRKASQPPFTPAHLKKFVPLISDHATRFIDDCLASSNDGRPVNVTDASFKVAMSVAAEAFLGIRPDEDMSEFRRAMGILGRFTMDRIAMAIRLPLSLPSDRNREFHKAKLIVDRVVYHTITQRRAKGSGGNDMLSRLMFPADRATPGGLTDEQLRDQVVTLFLAGFDTTASALALCCFHLATHELICLEVQKELDERIAAGDTIEKAAHDSERLRAVILEVLRLYPPVPLFSRRAVNEEVVGSFKVPKSAEVWICPYLTHRHPSYWPNAYQFLPWRWLEPGPNPMVRNEYMPFGKGPHVCIGAVFAMMELEIILGKMIESCMLSESTVAIQPVARIALGTEEDVMIRLARRVGNYERN